MSMEEEKQFEAGLLKLDEKGEIYLGRPLPQEERSESSAKSSENAVSAKHQLYPLKSGSKNIKADFDLATHPCPPFYSSLTPETDRALTLPIN